MNYSSRTMKVLSNIFLVGPMGAGKSTIGRYIAEEMKLTFYDTDQEIEARSGVDVAWIFDVEGEEGFRRREVAVIAELTEHQGIVLATGGGAIVSPLNRNHLGGRGFVVYLQASVDQQWNRTRRDKSRPLLQQDNPRAALERLSLEREPLYLEIADLVVHTDAKTVKTVSSDIVKKLREL